MEEHSLVRTPRPRDEILQALKLRGGLFASEIAEALGTGTSAVRPHLEGLIGDGLVSVEVVRGGKGRPRHRYHLTPDGHESFRRDYAELAESLVQGLTQLGGTELLSQIFLRREQELVDRYAARLAGLDFDARVREVARILDERGHMVELDRSGEGYVLIEHNCPLSRVASESSVACESGFRLIRRLVDAEVEQLQVAPNGATDCRFAIRRARDSTSRRKASRAR